MEMSMFNCCGNTETGSSTFQLTLQFTLLFSLDLSTFWVADFAKECFLDKYKAAILMQLNLVRSMIC